MMKLGIISSVMGAAGVLMILHSQDAARGEAKSRAFNPLELKGSPYGEVIGMALQDPVHLIWHGGRGHDDAAAQTKLENNEGDICEVCGIVHDDTVEDIDESYLEGLPQRIQWKGELLLMSKYTRFNHSPVPRRGLVKQYEQNEVRKLLQLAYEMDPTNYGNYNALNFYYFQEAGEGETVSDKVESLALETIRACEEGKRVDPMDALTSASAAENILVWKFDDPDTADLGSLTEAYHRFKAEVDNCASVIAESAESGRLGLYSEARITEMQDRFNLFSYNLREYGKKIQDRPKIFR
ncbi:hypothetical protein Rhal01_03377 [Rubritalea halochordaticola]|uniref:Uncharacterized protein n=1 Tax=Rubritalea halochordaticola TaxID=714537 RepID=A0ABP9V3F0_9BACT